MLDDSECEIGWLENSHLNIHFLCREIRSRWKGMNVPNCYTGRGWVGEFPSGGSEISHKLCYIDDSECEIGWLANSNLKIHLLCSQRTNMYVGGKE